MRTGLLFAAVWLWAACSSNDIGLGTSTRGAGDSCGSTGCTLGNGSAAGHGWLWGR